MFLTAKVNMISRTVCRSSRSVSHQWPKRRRLHLAPPFLVEDYVPHYLRQQQNTLQRKREESIGHLKQCNICPRRCNVNRYERVGTCLIGADAVVNTAAPHFGEESCIQGVNGSGTIFFSGCNLRCVFCQNWNIAHKADGFPLTPREMADWMVKLQNLGGCHNINFVTPEHAVPQVALAIIEARDMGLRVPIVYNTGGYDAVEAIELLDGLVDIYLVDFKVWEEETAAKLLKAKDYPIYAREGIKAMHGQVGHLVFSSDGLAKQGVLVRHLVMPNLQHEGARIMEFLAKEVSPDTFVSLLSQYRPTANVGKKDKKRTGESVRYAEIDRGVLLEEEVEFVRRKGIDAGLWRFDDRDLASGIVQGQARGDQGDLAG